MDIKEKLDNYLNEAGKIKKTGPFKGTTNDGKKVRMGQEKSGMFYGEIRDKSGNIESSTTKKTQTEVMKWFEKHNIKKINWIN